ncbi:MAG: hypothetical protein AAB879_02570, partial [Patescibacteria group bacterium]
MKRFRIFFISVLLSAVYGLPYAAPALAQPAYSLIKGSTSTVYFYSNDGKRYVFPNEKTFASWYPISQRVLTMEDAHLAFMPLGGNVTIKPGSALVKITTDPRVYAVDRGRVLRWVTTENLAGSLYGANWNKSVIDIPDALFRNYLIGAPIEHATDISIATFENLTLTDLELFGSGSISVTPPSAPVPASSAPSVPTPTRDAPTLRVTLTASQAVLNQQIQVFTEIAGYAKPIKKLEIKTENGGASLATCLNSTTCSVTYVVTTAPQIETFYAIATDESGPIAITNADRATLVVSSVSNALQMSVTPQTIAQGSRASFTSEYTTRGFVVRSHKIFALFPGISRPVLWKECGGVSSCAGSTVFYRTTDIFSQIMTDGNSIVSPVMRVVAAGGETPKPFLRATSASKNIVTIDLTPPYGEMIGSTFIVNGTRPDDQPYALCDG